MSEADIALVVRRRIRASPARLFEAWTTPAQLMIWWGPRDVRCTYAEVEASVGGRYRIDNELPDGRVVTIAGEFLAVEPSTRLVYTWGTDPAAGEGERVTVLFEAVGDETDVIVIHERVVDEPTRREHEDGWEGCLEGLAVLVGS